MTRAEEYRLRAREAEEQASKVRDHRLKQSFLDIARQWRELADQADRHGWEAPQLGACSCAFLIPPGWDAIQPVKPALNERKRPRCNGPMQSGQNKAKFWHAPSSTMPQHFP